MRVRQSNERSSSSGPPTEQAPVPCLGNGLNGRLSGENGLQEIRRSLGPATYDRGGVLLYHGDALRKLANVPCKSIGLTVTSPPYNIGKEYERTLPLAEYLEWSKAWMNLVYEATSASGAFWINLGYIEIPGSARAVPLPYLLWNTTNFFLQQEIVWNYAAGVSSTRAFSPRNEKFLWYVRDPASYLFNLDAVRDRNVKYPNQKRNGRLRCNPLGKNPSDVWQISKVTSGKNRSSPERTSHPAQFPVALIERIIRACSEEGDIILDPFMGSGSLAEAAIRCGRLAVGFEQSLKYVEVAQTRLDSFMARLESAKRQPGLFNN